MSSREQLLNIIDFIGENEAAEIMQFIKNGFLLKSKTWDDIEEDDPEPDEIEALREGREEIERGEFVKFESREEVESYFGIESHD